MIQSKVKADQTGLANEKQAQLSNKLGNAAAPIPAPESAVVLQPLAPLPKSSTAKTSTTHHKEDDQSDQLLGTEQVEPSAVAADIGAPTEFSENHIVLAQVSTDSKSPDGGAAVVSDTATHSLAPQAASAAMAPQEMVGWGFVGLAGAAALSGGAGAGAAATATPVGFSLSGGIWLGKITSATGLTIEAFKADGTKLAGTAIVNDNGTFTINVTENYTGPVLVRLKDTIAGPNYIDEGTGLAQDLTTDLRALVNVSGHGAITVSLTPLTELAVRELLGDAGGDAGTASTTLGSSVTAAQVTAANDGVKAAFGLTGDIVGATPVAVNDAGFSTATAAQKAYGQALAAISGAETVQTLTTGDVLKALSQGLVAGKLSQSAVDLLIAGAQQADGVSSNTSGSATALTAALGTGLSGIHISSDTGALTNDFITQTAGQTITATLDHVLGGTSKLWGSVDSGAHWIDLTALGFVSGANVSWTGATLSGTNTIQFAQTSSSVTVFTGSAKDVVGSVAQQAYSLDTSAPVFTSASGVSFAENATTVAYKAVTTDVNLVTYALSGTDQALFTIDSNSGAVSFKTAPNFEAPTDAGGVNAYAITVTAVDGAGNSSSQAVVISVTNVNEAPNALTSGATATFAENGTGVAYTATGTDPDAGTALSYVLGGVDAARFNINSATGAVTFKTAPNFEAPADAGANNVYDITVTSSDGSLTSAAQPVAITVTNVNEAPVMTSGATATLAENATGTVYTATATDQDANTTLSYALGGSDAALFNINTATGAVSFKAAPNFESPQDVGANNVYDITVTASDGSLSSAAQAVAITVTDVNEAPTSTAVSAPAVVKSQPYSFNLSGNFTDVDATDHLTYVASGLPTGLTINATTGIISGTATATGVSHVTVTATDTAAHSTSQIFDVSVVVQPVISTVSASVAQAKVSDALTLTVTLSEAVTVSNAGVPTLDFSVGGQTMTATYVAGSGTNALMFSATTIAGDSAAVSVSAIHLNSAVITGTSSLQPLLTTSVGQTIAGFVIDNSNPVFSSSGSNSYAENGTGTAYASAASDATTLTYTLTGPDANAFNISSTTGAVTFKASPNFEAPTDVGTNNVYDVTVTATDALGHQTANAVAITVTNVNEAPNALTSGATATFVENGTGVAYTATGTDPDAGTTLSYILGGVDKALFNINSLSGAVTFKVAPNFEAPADAGANNVYDITVTSSDGSLTSAAQPVAITVTNVNEAPVMTSGAAATLAENATGTVYTATATDQDANTTLSYVLGGSDAALFNINGANGAVSFKAAPNFEVPLDVGANNVYDITVTASDGLLSSTQAVAITVTNVNEAPNPLTSGASASFAENGTGVAYTAGGTDPDANTTLSYILSGADKALFNINSLSGAVTFKVAPNYEAPADAGANNVYDITVTSSDGTLTSAAQAVAITVTNVNEAPVLTSGSAVSVAENTTGVVYTATSTDQDLGNVVTYVLGGADQLLFNLNSTTGAVTFKTTPNFEAPLDAGANNVYDITVTATDGSLSSTTQAVAITVTNVNEAPTSTAVTAPVVVIAQAYSLDVSSHFTDVDAGDHLTYAATSLPTGLSINATTGIISGTVNSASHSSVTVTATDTAAHSTSQSFSVDAFSAPTLSSHIDNVTNFEVTSNIVLTSTENLTGVAGKFIHIINDGGTGFHGENITNTQDISVTDTAHVSIVNNTITINPGFDLDFNNNYHIMVDAGAFVGVSSHLDSVATASATDMNFGTVSPGDLHLGAAAASSQAMVGSTDAMVAGHNWLDVEGSSLPGGTPVTLDMSNGNIAVAINDIGLGGIATNDFYVALNNFANGDLIYFDNHGDNTLQRQSDFDLQSMIGASTDLAPTIVSTAASGSGTGSNGGQFDVTVSGSTAIFADTGALKILLGSVNYEPILYG